MTTRKTACPEPRRHTLHPLSALRIAHRPTHRASRLPAWSGTLVRSLVGTALIGVIGTTVAAGAATAGTNLSSPTGARASSVLPTAGVIGTHVTGVVGPQLSIPPRIGPTPTPAPTPTPPTTAGVKAPVVGLVDRHHAPTSAYAPAVRSFVVNTTWASLQPVKGGAIVHPNAIDTAIAAAKAGNYTLKLRIAAGIGAPAWAKSMDGAPLTLYNTAATTSSVGTVAGTIGRFWLPDFGVAYADLQTKLAALYDAVPQIRETDITECSGIYSETFLRDAMDRRNVTTLLNAGYTLAQDEQCHNQQIQAHQVWKQTPSDLSFNPYVSISSTGTVRNDLAYTESQMVYCRSLLGVRCVLSNHSLSASRAAGTGTYAQMYAYMKKLGGAIDFQTSTEAKIGDYETALNDAVALGARSVELPTGYTDWSEPTLAGLAAKLK